MAFWPQSSSFFLNGSLVVEYFNSSGRPKTIQYLYEKEKSKSFEQDKFGPAGLNQPQKNSWCPLHHAIVEGHLETAEILLNLGAQIEKPLNANFDRLTPLMLACARGDLEIVTILVTKHRAKVEKRDKYKRTG